MLIASVINLFPKTITSEPTSIISSLFFSIFSTLTPCADIFFESCLLSRSINALILLMDAAYNSGSIFVIVFKFFIRLNFDASAIAIFKVPFAISKGTRELS